MPPGWTLLAAVKLPKAEVWKLSDPEEESRLSNATSEGELTLVGTFGVENVGGPLVRPTLEPSGKTWYISTTTWPMLAMGFAPVSRPERHAWPERWPSRLVATAAAECLNVSIICARFGRLVFARFRKGAWTMRRTPIVAGLV